MTGAHWLVVCGAVVVLVCLLTPGVQPIPSFLGGFVLGVGAMELLLRHRDAVR